MEICPKDMSPTLCCYCCPETTCDSCAAWNKYDVGQRDCHCKGSSPTKCPYRVNSVVYLGKKLKGPQKELVINAYTPNNSGEKDGVSK